LFQCPLNQVFGNVQSTPVQQRRDDSGVHGSDLREALDVFHEEAFFVTSPRRLCYVALFGNGVVAAVADQLVVVASVVDLLNFAADTCGTAVPGCHGAGRAGSSWMPPDSALSPPAVGGRRGGESPSYTTACRREG